MNWFHTKRMLQARGYWAPAGDGTGGGGGGSGDGTGSTGGDGGSEGGEGSDGGEGSGEGAGEGGKPKPTDAEAKLLKELMGKKTKLTEAQSELAQAKELLKKFEGLDPEAVRAMIAEAEERKTKDLEAKGQWDALKKQITDAHGKLLNDKEAVIGEVNTKLSAANALIAELTVGNAFGNSAFIVKEMSLPIAKARALFGSHFEFDGTKVVGYNKPAGAKDRVELVGADGNALPFDEALRKLVEADPDKDHLLKSTVKPGAGSKSEKGAPAPKPASDLKGRDRIAAALAARKK
jgi:hypothetical protein